MTDRHVRTGLATAALVALSIGPVATAATRPAAAALPAHALQALGSYNAPTGYPPKCNIVCKGNFPYSPWAYADGYVLGARADGLLEVSRLHLNSASMDVDTVDPTTFRITTRHTIRVSGGWKIWGDYLGPDGSLYVLTTHANNDDSNSRDVVAVRKYDAQLHQVGTARLTGGAASGGINSVPGSGSPSMTMLGTKLLVNTSRQVYAAVGGQHHEASLAFVVDTSNMTAAATNATYVSHSFNQFVATDGNLSVFIDHGDAYPRALTLDEITGYLTGMPGSCTTCMVRRIEILKFRGSLGDNFTGATLNGFAVGPSGALTTGVADPDQHGLDGVHGNNVSLMPNAYLISTDLTSGTSKFVWLTRNSPTNTRDVVGQPRLVQVGTDSFAILFSERLGMTRLLQYRLVNSAGAILATKTWRNVNFSPMGQPTVLANRIFWVGAKGETSRGAGYLYGLSVTNPAKPTLLSH